MSSLVEILRRWAQSPSKPIAASIPRKNHICLSCYLTEQYIALCRSDLPNSALNIEALGSPLNYLSHRQFRPGGFAISSNPWTRVRHPHSATTNRRHPRANVAGGISITPAVPFPADIGEELPDVDTCNLFGVLGPAVFPS